MAAQLLSLLFLCVLSFPQCSLPPVLLPPLPTGRQGDPASLLLSIQMLNHCDSLHTLLSEIIKSLRQHDYLNSKPCCTDRLACLLIEKTGTHNESSRVRVYKIHVWLRFYSNMRTLFILSLIEIFETPLL